MLNMLNLDLETKKKIIKNSRKYTAIINFLIFIIIVIIVIVKLI